MYQTEKQKPYCWQIGNGPGVICFHCSTGSSKQWQPLADLLSERFTVAGVDLYGYGKSPIWISPKRLTLADEAALIEPLLERIDTPVTLVGHSYGGAVALSAAFHYADQIRNVIVYEPVLFNLLFDKLFDSVISEEISAVKRRVHEYLSDKLYGSAARMFIDYWSGYGAFDQLPEHYRNGISSKMSKVLMDFEAAFNPDLTPDDIKKISLPALLLYGQDSPSASRQVIHHLSETLPNAEIRGLIGMGHMGPVTHREQINEIIAGYLERSGSAS